MVISDKELPNIILISLDCVRPDHLGCYGYTKANTPRIDQIYKDTNGLLFTHTITQAPFTTPSHASMLTGLYPFNHHVRLLVGQRLNKNIPNFATILKSYGYITGGFPSIFLMTKETGFSNGFDVFNDSIDQKIAGRGHWKPGKYTIEDLIDFIKNTKKKPFAAFIHLFDAHEFGGLAKGFVQRYDQQITVLDTLIGRIIDCLHEEEKWDNTLLIITADHGESLNEHGETSHGKALYDSTLRVPLIFRIPGLQPKMKKNIQQVRSIDILPTILDCIGLFNKIKEKNIVFDGVSLLPVIKGQKYSLPAYCETSPIQLFTGDRVTKKEFKEVEMICLRYPTKKYIFKNHVYKLPVRVFSYGSKLDKIAHTSFGKKIDYKCNQIYARLFPSASGDKEELYDLHKDPKEQKNLANQQPEQCRQMKQELDQLIAEHSSLPFTWKDVKKGEEMNKISKTLKKLKNI